MKQGPDDRHAKNTQKLTPHWSGCRITFLSLKKLFVFPFFRIARMGGNMNAQIILGAKMQELFHKQQKNAFEIILVYRNISIF
jgi:hypothetical protein